MSDFDSDELRTLWVLYDWFRISRRDQHTPVAVFDIIHGNTHGHPAQQILDAVHDAGGPNPYTTDAEQRLANARFVATRAAATRTDLDLPGGNNLGLPFPTAGLPAEMVQTAVQLGIPGVQAQAPPPPPPTVGQANRPRSIGDQLRSEEQSSSDHESEDSSDDPSSVDENDPKATADNRVSWTRKSRRVLYTITVRHAPKYRDWSHYIPVLKEMCDYLKRVADNDLRTRAMNMLSQLAQMGDARYKPWARVVPELKDTGRVKRHKVNEMRRVREAIEAVERQLNRPVGGPPADQEHPGGDDVFGLEELKGASTSLKGKALNEASTGSVLGKRRREDDSALIGSQGGRTIRRQGATITLDAQRRVLGMRDVFGVSDIDEDGEGGGNNQSEERSAGNANSTHGFLLPGQDGIAPENLVEDDDDVQPTPMAVFPEIREYRRLAREHELEAAINTWLQQLDRALTTDLVSWMFSQNVFLDGDAWRAVLVTAVQADGTIDILEAVRAIHDSFSQRNIMIRKINVLFDVLHAFVDQNSPLSNLYLFDHAFKKPLRMLHHTDIDMHSDVDGPVVNTTRADGSRVTFISINDRIHKHKGKVYRVKVLNKGQSINGAYAELFVWVDVMICEVAVCAHCNPGFAGEPHERHYGFVHREDVHTDGLYQMQWPREEYGQIDGVEAIAAITFIDGFARWVYVCGKGCMRCNGGQ